MHKLVSIFSECCGMRNIGTKIEVAGGSSLKADCRYVAKISEFVFRTLK